jgi:hypothetical protein
VVILNPAIIAVAVKEKCVALLEDKYAKNTMIMVRD